MGWSNDPGPSRAGKFPAVFYREVTLRELSIFIDESGDFGPYDCRSPYYIVAMVFHEQQHDIKAEVQRLDAELRLLGLPNLCIHTGPIIRREEAFRNMDICMRRRIFNKLVAFARNANIKQRSFYVDKKNTKDSNETTKYLSKQITGFIISHLEYLQSFDHVKIYYDNGQVELSKILSSVFSTLLPGAIFKKVLPSDYKLFQVADLVCTLKLVELKMETVTCSKTAQEFFHNSRDFKKNYLQKLQAKELL